MKYIILIQLSGCTAKSPFTNPLKESIHPEMAVPRPPPIFTPKDVQEYMEPSILFPFVRYVYSEQFAITAFISPCHGPCPKAAIAVKSNINGTFPI